jgi:hypothetical protein
MTNASSRRRPAGPGLAVSSCMHARTHAADVPYAGGAGPVEVSSKLAIDKRPSWPVAAVGLAGARIFQSQGGRTEETRAPGVEERGGAVYVGVRDSLSISSFLRSL